MTTSPVPGGKVDDQEVELAPLHLLEELADDLVQHRSAHHQRLVAGRDQPDRDELHAVRQDRLDAIVSNDVRLPCRSEHRRHVRPVDVSVDQADLMAQLGQCDRQIHRDGGLADSALAAADRYNVRYSRQRLRPLRCSCSHVSHNPFS